MFKNSGMYFIHLNVNSFLTKNEEIHHPANLTNVSITGIIDRKLDESLFSDEVAIESYDIIRIDRSEKRGGVAFLICLLTGKYFHRSIPIQIEIVYSKYPL